MMSSTTNTEITHKAASKWIVGGILLLAVFLRLYKLDLISVTNDTASQELSAWAALSFEGWSWPLAGAPTDDVRSSVFLISAIALADLFWPHPFSGTVLVIVLNVVAVVLVYRLCAKQFGFQSAWIATLLYAASPWGVLYSRFLLPSSCLAVFGVWLLHLSLRWLEEDGPTRQALMVLLALALPQIHFSALWVPLWLIVVLYLGRKQVSYVSLAVGGLLGAAVWAPWLEYHRVTGFVELRTWLEEVFQRPELHARAFLQSIQYLQCQLHSSCLDYWFGAGPSQWPEYFPAWQRWGAGTSSVLLTALLIVAVAGAFTRQADRASRLLVLWMVFAVLFGTLLRTGRSPENMWIASPVPFVLVGLVLQRLQIALRPRLRFVPTAAVLAIAAMHVLVLAGWAQFVDDGRTTNVGRYELSYRQRQATIQSILEDAVAWPVRLVGSDSGWYAAYEYVLLYAQASPSAPLDQDDQVVCYWIDEEQPADGMNETSWTSRKEREINPAISEYFRSPPDWEIERHWTVGVSHVYRVRFVKKEPLR